MGRARASGHSGRVLAASLAFLCGSWVAACGAFSLNDVHPPTDAAVADVSDARAPGTDSSGSADAGDAKCIPDQDPCRCIAPTLVTAGPHTGSVTAIGVTDGNVYWLSTDTMPNPLVLPFVVGSSAVDASVIQPIVTPGFPWDDNFEQQMPSPRSARPVTVDKGHLGPYSGAM